VRREKPGISVDSRFAGTGPVRKSDRIKRLRGNSRSEENREIFYMNRENNRPNREIREFAK
jgi:hypothetical protein